MADPDTYPLPFMIQSGGANYAVVERHNLSIKNTQLWPVVWQAMGWIVEALRFDARTDCRRPIEDQEFASFLCSGNEYEHIRMRELEDWHESNPEGTLEEFEAQFDIDAIDDSVRQPLPELIFFIFDEGAPWPTENIEWATGFRGVFYVWNTRTVLPEDPPLPEDVWLVSPNPMLGAPLEGGQALGWWLDMFADLMHTMLSYELPLSDGRRLWLQAWQFPTARTCLAWRSGEGSVFVPQIKQKLIAHGLELPDPAYVVEERFVQPKPDIIGGGWMAATRRMRHYTGYPLW